MSKFKIITLLGIRPDYIRMAKLIRLLDVGQGKHNYKHLLVHSGQHYDPELFGNFLKEFKIRKPDFNLNIGLDLKKKKDNNHASQLSLLSEKVFNFIKKEKPDLFLYLGDTNTVLSSIVVSRSNIPVVHIEAGGRSYDWRMPEEKNRLTIDHLSDVLYCYLDRYKENLLYEGIDFFRIKTIGNIIVDPINDYLKQIEESDILNRLGIESKKYILLTLHREENTSNKKILKYKLSNVAKFAREKNIPVVFPIMPRVLENIKKYKLNNILENSNFLMCKPLGFFDFIKCEKEAKLIVSDSGTVQEEALLVGTPCVIARRSTERPETIWAGATILEGEEGDGVLFNKMKKAWNLKNSWDKTILNPYKTSPSEIVFKDLIGKIKKGYFKKSRSFGYLKYNKLARDSYNK